MQKFLLILLTIFLSLGLAVSTAEAKRFGGGGNVGKQRSVYQHNYNSGYANSNRTATNQATKPQSGLSRWLGPLAGFALGGLLASMFMGHGGGLLGLLLLLIAGFALFAFLRRKTAPPAQAMRYADTANSYSTGHAYTADSYSSTGQQAQNDEPVYPPGFNAAAFLHNAKTLFIRLQAAYDQSNLDDIREFTTPEVFAEIRLQLQERGTQKNITDVVSLDAELIDSTKEGFKNIISVRFSGTIREEENAEPINFNEIWHFQQSAGSGWLVAGIQQN